MALRPERFVPSQTDGGHFQRRGDEEVLLRRGPARVPGVVDGVSCRGVRIVVWGRIRFGIGDHLQVDFGDRRCEAIVGNACVEASRAAYGLQWVDAGGSPCC